MLYDTGAQLDDNPDDHWQHITLGLVYVYGSIKKEDTRLGYPDPFRLI